MTLLDFCANCEAKRLIDVKEELQKIFASKEKLKENVCSICRSQLSNEKTLDKQESTVKVEVKTEPGTDVASGNASKDVGRRAESTQKAKDVTQHSGVSQSGGTFLYRWNPSGAVASPMVPQRGIRLQPGPVFLQPRTVLLQPGAVLLQPIAVKTQTSAITFAKTKEQGKNRRSASTNAAASNNKQEQIKMDTKSANENISLKTQIVVKKLGGSTEKAGPSRAHRELRALRREVLDVMGPSTDEERPYQCTFCNQTPFLTVTKFLRHVAKHTGTDPITEPFQCRKCSKTFKTVLAWFKHTNERLFKCTHPGCSKSFTNSKTLSVHIKKHSATRKFPCEQCDRVFSTKGILGKHIKVIHMGIKDKACRFCGWCFESSQAVKRHERTHTNERPFKCDKCEKAFIQKSTLQTHMMDHTGERPYVCELCGYATKWSSDLKIHRMRHTGKKPYQCEQCGQRFVRKDSLKLHLKRVHERIKTEKCRYCDQSFRYEKTLFKHEKMHPEWTGVRHFVCDICGKDCHDGSTLQGHMNMHNNVKPYECKYCDYKTSWSSNLIMHTRRHTAHEKCYRCSYCSMRFTSHEKCQDHKKICKTKKMTNVQVDSTTSSEKETK